MWRRKQSLDYLKCRIQQCKSQNAYILQVQYFLSQVNKIKMLKSLKEYRKMLLLNKIFHLPVLELTIIIFRHIKMRTWNLVGQQYRAWSEARMCKLALLCTDCQRLCTFSPSRNRVVQPDLHN